MLTVPEAGMMGASDEEQIALALREGRVTFTQDDDFLRLAAAGVPHAGIIYVRQHTPVREILHGLRLIYEVLDAEDMQDHVEFL